MTNILSIGTAVPQYRHEQSAILNFMQRVYALSQEEERKLKFVCHQSGIQSRYSVLPDYSRLPNDWVFYPAGESLEPFPSLELRMKWFEKEAAPLSVAAIEDCLEKATAAKTAVTHLITVSCTGLSAPGLDLQTMEQLGLPWNLHRSSINFMGCYAALHGLKQADAICRADPDAVVLLVCTELCTLHFQKQPSADNITASMLFGDGSAAVLLSGRRTKESLAELKGFYAEVIPKGKDDMSWQLSSTGFQMTLSGYIPELISTDFKPLLIRALGQYKLTLDDIKHWCIHPGGKRILQKVQQSLDLPEKALAFSEDVLKEYGNMSSPSILFVLDKLLQSETTGTVIGAAFGPGLTMETVHMEMHNTNA